MINCVINSNVFTLNESLIHYSVQLQAYPLITILLILVPLFYQHFQVLWDAAINKEITLEIPGQIIIVANPIQT